MADNTYTVTRLAEEIHENIFDEDDTLMTVSRIEAWLAANIGSLNTLIHSSFDSEFAPPDSDVYVFGYEEASIYTQVYLEDYYKKLARKVIQGSFSVTGVTMSEWTKIVEGDTTIERKAISPADASRAYTSLAKEAAEKVLYLVGRYNRHAAKPRQVNVKNSA